MRALFFLLLFATLANGQQVPKSVAGKEAADIAVVGFSWRKERLPGWENRTVSSSIESYDAMRERVENERRIQQARNAGRTAEVARLESAAKMLEDAGRAKDARKAERPRDGYRYKVELANKGSKTISVVDWDYFFLDPNTQQVLARHQFTSEEKIKPGKSKELSVLYLTPPVKTVSAGMLAGKEPWRFLEQVVVIRIEYADGSIWQHP